MIRAQVTTSFTLTLHLALKKNNKMISQQPTPKVLSGIRYTSVDVNFKHPVYPTLHITEFPYPLG